jgi:hypothetical protein
MAMKMAILTPWDRPFFFGGAAGGSGSAGGAAARTSALGRSAPWSACASGRDGDPGQHRAGFRLGRHGRVRDQQDGPFQRVEPRARVRTGRRAGSKAITT